MEPLAQLVEHRPFKPRVVGSIPTRLTLQRLDRVREILGALRRGKRLGRGRQQTVSKRSRSDAAHGFAQVLQREVPVRAGRGRHRRAPQDALHAVRIEDWGKLLGDTAAVAALLDRMLHHGQVLKCGPRSWRARVEADLHVESAAG